MSWDMAFANSYNVPKAGAATVPRPTIVLPEACDAILAKECGDIGRGQPDGRTTQRGGAGGFADDDECCCATENCPGACPLHYPLLRDQPLFFGLNFTSKAALSNPDPATRLPQLNDDIAKFLMLRGECAWLGFAFESCHADTNCTLPPAPFERDYGVPVGNCSAVAGKPRTWSRRYSKVVVEVTCGGGSRILPVAAADGKHPPRQNAGKKSSSRRSTKRSRSWCLSSVVLRGACERGDDTFGWTKPTCCPRPWRNPRRTFFFLVGTKSSSRKNCSRETDTRERHASEQLSCGMPGGGPYTRKGCTEP